MRYRAVPLFLALCFASLVSSYSHHIEIIPAAQSNLASVAQYISSHNGLDAPHVTPINESSYEWWYFDVYSEDTQTSVVVVFFNAPGTGFPLSGGPPNDITEAYLFVSVPGQPLLVTQNVSATESVVDYAGNGASGDWKGSGFSFKGEPDMSEYTVSIDYPELAYKGELTFKSKAPAHYPCDRAKSGVTMELMPHVGWSNAIPYGEAEVHLTVNGTAVDFTGVGYHDKNWGDAPFSTTVGSWFWGHGRLGPYSLVWFDALTPSGAENVSVYIATDSSSSSPSPHFQLSSCVASSIVVRPSGANDSYPPSLLASPAGPSGHFHIVIELGGDGGKSNKGDKMIIDVSPTVVIGAVPGLTGVGRAYARWTGTLKGYIVAGDGKKKTEDLVGTALYEQFTLMA